MKPVRLSSFLPQRSRCVPLLLLLPAFLGAQDPCDSLDILHVRYHPFTDTVVNVRVHNTSAQFFSGPQFHLITAADDTVAVETMEFFGIGNGMQTHHLQLLPGMAPPAPLFNGSLALVYYGWEGEDTCAYAVDTDLCPPDSCTPMSIFLYSLAGSGQLFTTDFTWQVIDELGSTAAAGSIGIEMDDQQQAFADLCLPPGHYALHIDQQEAVGLEYNVGVCQQGNQFENVGPSVVMVAGTQATVPFHYYASCLDGSNGLVGAQAAPPVVVIDGSLLRISSGNGAPLGALQVLDATGRSVARMSTPSSAAVLDLGSVPPGVYLLFGTGASQARRFVLR